jgi:GNAT superfamily N-acetyltransferase
MSDLYSKYLLEKEGKETIEIPGKGFITYKIVHASEGNMCHVCILYVDPKERNTRIARELMHALKDKYSSTCKAFTAAVYTRQFNTTATLKTLLFYGFEVVGIQNEEILLYKEF